MNDRPIDGRCGILDLLEAAAMHADDVDIRRGGDWQRLTVRDVVSEAGEDWLVTADDRRVAVSDIGAARPARDA